MMIVSVTRDPRDVAAIRASGVRATLAASVGAGLLVASRSDARLIVCDVALDAHIGSGLRHAEIPCPIVLRHDLSREAIGVLCDVARLDADIRLSFRGSDDLAAQLGDLAGRGEGNATREILRGIAPADGSRVRDFIGVMAVLGEQPVMQTQVARPLAMSSSSFRAWLALLRRAAVALPPFPRLNAHFVALHLLWRRERLGWTGKRSAAAAGFADDKACANYLRYHLGATGGQLLRGGGFDARMTAARHLFETPQCRGAAWRI
jgi:hypothetical protein